MLLLKFGEPPFRHGLASSVALFATLSILALFLPDFSNGFGSDTVRQQNHIHPPIIDPLSSHYGSPLGNRYDEIDGYVPDFVGFDRSIIGRADDPTPLHNNVPEKSNIVAGDTFYYTFSKTNLQRSQAPLPPHSLAERSAESPRLDAASEDWHHGPQRRQAGTSNLYITLSMCDQPGPTSPKPNGAPPPLQLYISTNPQNPNPNAKNNDITVPVAYGLGSHSLSLSSDVFLAVTAPAKSPNFDDEPYSYELTASTDEFYTTSNEGSTMVLVDSDANSALLCSGNDTGPVSYSIFVQNQQDPVIWGLQNSFCGLKTHAQIQNVSGSSTGDVKTVLMALDGFPRRQHFYVNNLNDTSAYYAIMAIDGNATTGKAGSGVAGGGGTVMKITNFTTKTSDNCAVIYNLTFCSEVAYAVPSNQTKQPNITALGETYDNNVQRLYQNFNYSLQQIPCNTTNSAQYSLVRNCTSCANAYKTWLCAVTIPRCEDSSNPADYLLPRPVNKSRSSWISNEISPGSYNEVLPCIGLCYDLVQSCPASLGFACPLERHGLNQSYGFNKSIDGDPTCNYPGAVFRVQVGLARALQANIWLTMIILIGVSAGI